jgi:hypothetical protein
MVIGFQDEGSRLCRLYIFTYLQLHLFRFVILSMLKALTT